MSHVLHSQSWLIDSETVVIPVIGLVLQMGPGQASASRLFLVLFCIPWFSYNEVDGVNELLGVILLVLVGVLDPRGPHRWPWLAGRMASAFAWPAPVVDRVAMSLSISRMQERSSTSGAGGNAL